jgi:dipeptidyl aminopeptidase/acylaminoacyl peptidase
VYLSEESGYSNLFIVDTTTGSRRSLFPDDADYLSPKWSPDGKTIAYVRNEGGKFQLFQIAVQGEVPVRLSERDGVNGGFENDNASPRGMFQWSADGTRIAFTHSDPAHTSDVWVVTPNERRPLQLTNSMPVDMRREARFVWPEVMTYRSFDGMEVAGLVYKPHGAKPKAGHPALLMFRDTLDGQHAFAWDPFIQFFVSDGYLVFAPNVRGSGGYGVTYRQSIFHFGGDHDVRDAFIGLDKLSSEGLIDAERVGIYGAGIGGFLATAALIKDEARFKAAVCLYGIVDATTASSYPAMASWARYMIGQSPIESPVPFYERSLLNFVDKLRTPIIFLYSGNDGAAPFQQLQQFAVQASVKGKWFDYRVFENETSGWQNWRPASFRQGIEAMDALFERYLLGRERELRLTRDR